MYIPDKTPPIPEKGVISANTRSYKPITRIMEKKLTYEEKVKIQNNLTHIKGELGDLKLIKNAIYKYIDEINEILNKKDTK